jgi:hypothetical protein
MKNKTLIFLFSLFSIFPACKRDPARGRWLFSIFYFLFSIFLLPFFIPSALAEGEASLYLSPSTGSYAIGEVFPAAVLINTGGKTINTAEGKISFNKNELEAVSISKDGSILTSWPSEPEFSNDEGVVIFGGSTEKDGYAGTEGKILSISFRALQSKASTVKFSMGAAIAATDGTGTNILTGMNAGKYELSPKEIIPSLESAIVSGTAESTSTPFAIVSPTHPVQTAWYATTTAELTWELSDDVVSVRVSFDQKATGTPTVVYSPPILKKTIKKIPEGVSYFHFQKWIKDEWTDLTHFRIAVDMTPPEKFAVTKAFTDKYGFTFDAEDAVSGIAKYSVRIDGSPFADWKDDGSHVFVPSGLTPGKHTLYAKAFDFAGNFTEQSLPFEVSEVLPPTLAKTPESFIAVGSHLSALWKADPSAIVRVFVAKEGSDPRADDAVKESDGNFAFTMKDTIEKGKYSVWAISIVKGVESKPTEKITVTGGSDIAVFGKKALAILGGAYAKISFAAIAVLILAYGAYRFARRNKTKQQEPIRPKTEATSAEQKKHIPVSVEKSNQEKSFQVRIQKRSEGE